MAVEVFQMLEELETFFADLICNTMGFPPEWVRIQYQPEGQPSSSIDEGMLYLKVSTEPDERNIFKNRTKVYNKADKTFTFIQQSSRTLTLQLVFYGQDSYDYCNTMNELFYLETVKLKLRQNYLSFVPDRTNGPYRLPEQHNGRWWERCDLELRFYNTISITETVNTFKEFDIRTEVN